MTGWLVVVCLFGLVLVTGQDLLRRSAVAVAYGIPLDTVVSVGRIWEAGETPPRAEAPPVFAELISVDGIAKNRQIGMAVNETLNLSIGKRAPIISAHQKRGKFNMVAGEERSNMKVLMEWWLQRRCTSSRNNLYRKFYVKSQCSTLAEISGRSCRLKNTTTKFWAYKPGLNPTSLVNLKIVPQVAPLKIGYQSVSYTGEYAYSLKNPPPWYSVLEYVLGFCGLEWGWVNFRNGRHIPISPIIFLAGCCLVVCGLFVLLPWSVVY